MSKTTEEQTQEVSVIEENGVAVQNDSVSFKVADLSDSNLPDLETEAEVTPLDLVSDYWTPETEGESRNVFFDQFGIFQCMDINDPDVLVDLECAVFIWKDPNTGSVKSLRNGSKRLVGALKSFSGLKRGMPLQITYAGKKKNKNNNFKSDVWSIKPLLLKI